MKHTAQKVQSRQVRHRRIRSSISGTPECPRLAFFRSNRQVYAQVIDDTVNKTIFGTSSLKHSDVRGAVAQAERVGAEIADMAKKKGITKVVFDRGGFMYAGSVRAFADTARAGGLQF